MFVTHIANRHLGWRTLPEEGSLKSIVCTFIVGVAQAADTKITTHTHTLYLLQLIN